LEFPVDASTTKLTMPFNWFERKHTDADQNPNTGTDPAASSDNLDADQSSTAAGATSSSRDETLDWAKLAYARIQERRRAEAAANQSSRAETSQLEAIASEASEPGVSTKPGEFETSEPEPMATTSTLAFNPEASAETGVEPLAVACEANLAHEAITISQSATVAGEADDHDPNAASPSAVQQATPNPQTAETPQSSSSIPFWAKAEAERSAKLERLSATVVETPIAPEQATAQTSLTPDAALDLGLESGSAIQTDLTFDEGFIWSAEVLAAQGRSVEDVSIEEITWLRRLRQGLDRTRRSLINQLKAIVGKGPLNDDAVLSIEEALLQADAGLEATDAVIEALQQQMRETVLPPDQAMATLKQILQNILDQPIVERGQQRFLAPEKDVLNVWLITGVNGAGKTTTIGKLAHIAQKSGYRCLIAAADTFRAAAVEQVKVWGQRSSVEVIANPAQNTDPASVVYDAISAAKARNTELLLVDTAGRLQNKKNLMEELGKIRRIIDKQAENARIESLLVLDATLGQNGLRQAEVFRDVANLSGVVLTKLDGTAKGGVALAVAQQLGLPIHFIGVGEGIEDLRPFSSYEFVEALLSS